MPLPKRTIAGILTDALGRLLPNVAFYIEPVEVFGDGGVIVPTKPVKVITDVNAAYSFDLDTIPGGFVRYSCELPGSEAFLFDLIEGSATSLDALRSLYTGLTGGSNVAVLDQALADIDALQAADIALDTRVDALEAAPAGVWGGITGDIEDQTDLVDYIADNTPAGGGLGSYFFDQTKLQHINCGRMYRPDGRYYHMFWEQYFKQSSAQIGAGYWPADTQGGAHAILFGTQMANSTHFGFTGNFNDGSVQSNSYATDEVFPADHWTVAALGWDGSHVMIWVEGVLVYMKAFSPPYRMNGGGNDECFYLAGSDHNNPTGWLAFVRLLEGYGRCVNDSDYTPEMFPRPQQYISNSSIDLPQFCMDLTREQTIFTDYGSFEGGPHHGVPEAVQATDTGKTGASIGYTLSLPTFQPGESPVYGTHTPTAPTTPSGAVIWDSFSRPNRNWLHPDPYSGTPISKYTLGQVEVGGVLWTNLDGSPDSGGAGVLNGRAFIFYGTVGKAVQTGLQDVDVRVDRLPTVYSHTGLYVRYKDANNYYKIIAYDYDIVVTKVVGGVSTAVGFTPASLWRTLRVTAVGTTMKIYTGTSTEGVFTELGSFACSNVAGATKAGLERGPGVKEPHYADNFLVKAGA